MRSALRIILFALDALSLSYHSSIGSDSIYLLLLHLLPRDTDNVERVIRSCVYTTQLVVLAVSCKRGFTVRAGAVTSGLVRRLIGRMDVLAAAECPD